MSRDDAPRGSFGGISRSRARSASREPVSDDHTPTPETMRLVRRQWASGVAVVTTAETDSERTRFRGATVSSFTVVSLEPPIVLVCLETGARTSELIPQTGRFAVSILSQSQTVYADRFAGLGPLPDASFTGVPHQIEATGSPVLTGSLAWFDCQVRDHLEAGDHVVILGDVVAAGLGVGGDDEPLLNYDGAYHRLDEP